jgi:hypothetical protein
MMIMMLMIMMMMMVMKTSEEYKKGLNNVTKMKNK